MDASEGQIKRIVLRRLGRCRVCHREYTDHDVKIVSRNPDMWMMVVECGECHARNFVAAVLNEGDPGQAELALRRMSGGEPEFQRAAEFDQPDEVPATPVTAADVADMHRFLESFNGDFRSLFRS
jgi:hypothetical protein